MSSKTETIMAFKETEGTSWTWYEGKWLAGNPQIMGPMTHAPWLGSCVFDGARAFEGTAPDLDLHCERLVRSAESFGLKVLKTAGEIAEIIREGIEKFPNGSALYLRPMFWAESGFVDRRGRRTKTKKRNRTDSRKTAWAPEGVRTLSPVERSVFRPPQLLLRGVECGSRTRERSRLSREDSDLTMVWSDLESIRRSVRNSRGAIARPIPTSGS